MGFRRSRSRSRAPPPLIHADHRMCRSLVFHHGDHVCQGVVPRIPGTEAGKGSASGSKGSKVDEDSKACTEVSEVDGQGTKGGAESSGGGAKGSKVDEDGAKGRAKGSKVDADVSNTPVPSFARDMRVIAQAHLAAWNNDITDLLFPPPSQEDGVKDSPEATKMSCLREHS